MKGREEGGVEAEDRLVVPWVDLGQVDHDRALEVQERVAAEARSGAGTGAVLFLEHPHTITLGYSLRGDEGRAALLTPAAELLSRGVRVVEVDRGGKATYHGPGQLVCYPVLELRAVRVGVKRWVSRLQNVVVGALKDLGVAAELDPAYPGVWVGGAKVAAVGVRIKERMNYHGFAVNLDPDLGMFAHIVPCGIADRPVTSLAALGVRASRGELIAGLLKRMEDELPLRLVAAPKEGLLAASQDGR